MLHYVLRRLTQAVLVCLGISVITFLLLHILGDPINLLLPLEATKEDIAQYRRAFGLDRPLYTQYWHFLSRALTGNFGQSLFIREPVLGLIAQRMPATLELAVTATAIYVGLGIPLGILAAVRRGTAVDTLANIGSVAGQAMPIYWLGLILIVIFTVHLRLLPASGRGSWRHLVLPAVTLAAYLAPTIVRLTRSAMIDVLDQDFIRTARAKGLMEWFVLWRHAFRNGAIPVATAIGLQFGRLLGGAIVVESVFAWPGLASLIVEGILNFDYPVVQASVVILAIFTVVTNLATDVVVALLDPRIRLR